jgi:hydroxypyruvate reductase/glycerate 2-kinase
LINVPEGCSAPLHHIHLNAARPAASNFPTPAGVAGAEEMLHLLASAGPDDTAVCLISGGGSALLPCPVEGVSLESKLAVTKLLTGCGATIHEMNCVRKHLSRVKGGRLAEAFRGKQLVSLIISDVIGDPLDVIASGPTAPDPTTFANAKAILERYGLWAKCPPDVTTHIQRGCDDAIPDTPKTLPLNVRNVVIGNNAVALVAARQTAEELGYRVLDLGPFVEGETRHVAAAVAGIVRNIRERSEPIAPPSCILIGGETTVTLGENPGKGGRNQEFVLAMLERLGADGMRDVAVLSGGTDGEDGPTDAAGAVADGETWAKVTTAGLSVPDHLARHNAYPFFDSVDGLIRTGPTGTNVADVRVILVR